MPPVPPIPVNYANLGDVRCGRFFWFIALSLISSHAHVRAAQSVRLAWNASPSSGVTGYRGLLSHIVGHAEYFRGRGQCSHRDNFRSPSCDDVCVRVCAYDSAGESSRSNEVSYKTPSAPSQTEAYYLTVVNGTVTSGIPGAHKIHDFLIRYYHNF